MRTAARRSGAWHEAKRAAETGRDDPRALGWAANSIARFEGNLEEGWPYRHRAHDADDPPARAFSLQLIVEIPHQIVMTKADLERQPIGRAPTWRVRYRDM